MTDTIIIDWSHIVYVPPPPEPWVRPAALWLRQQARATGARHAEHLLDRRHRPRRMVTLPRDTRGRWGAEGGMTNTDHYDLLEIAKVCSTGTAGQYAPACYPLLQPAAAILAEMAWQPTETCVACPRRMSNHVCSCPHNQAKKRLTSMGVWPDA